MKFCSACGNPVALRTLEGDHFARHVCESCGVVHYQNPKLIVGCVPEHEGRILLCRRAIEPRLGFWTIPAGFMEKHRDDAGRGTARIVRGGAGPGGNRFPAGRGARTARGPGPRDVSRQAARGTLRPEPGKPRSGSLRRNRDSVGRPRVPQRGFCATAAISTTVGAVSKAITSLRSISRKSGGVR